MEEGKKGLGWRKEGKDWGGGRKGRTGMEEGRKGLGGRKEGLGWRKEGKDWDGGRKERLQEETKRRKEDNINKRKRKFQRKLLLFYSEGAALAYRKISDPVVRVQLKN